VILLTVPGTSACTPRSEPAADETDSVAPEDRNVLPHTKPPFQGKIARTAAESTPYFPEGVQAPEGSPNVLLILTDDVGFGASSTFGGPVSEAHVDQMPHSFTGTLKKLVVVLQPEKLSEEERERLRKELSEALMSIH
jgi:hypothetical protein